jgi:hypothetical protein
MAYASSIVDEWIREWSFGEVTVDEKKWSNRRKPFVSANMLIVEFPVIGPISGLRRKKPETNHLSYSTTNSYDLRMFYVIISAHYCKDHTKTFL